MKESMSRPPEQPSYTCNDIDKIISGIEELRTANEALRCHGNYWESQASELENKMFNMEENTKALKVQVKRLFEAADEWAGYVEVDATPRTLREYLETAIEGYHHD
jgi:hypothetical protein